MAGHPVPSCISPTGCPALDASLLQPFTEKVIAAIREADQESLVWYAPFLVFDFGADTSLADTGDENAGFAFNMYCLGDALPTRAAPAPNATPATTSPSPTPRPRPKRPATPSS